MDLLYVVYLLGLLLHVLSFGAWFGLGLRLGGQARTVADAEPAGAALLAADGSRTIALMNGFVLLGYAAALAAFFASPQFAAEGMGGHAWPYHLALTLGLVLVAVQWALIRPAWARLRATVGAPEADRARGRVAMAMGLGHLTWFVLLVLMYWERLAA
ncbi:MAG: hypothetical protein R3181_09040 [Rubricoccaceae bacterium]|nr:hypothetical protein [Rubricoccaceae bacterium]